MSFQPDLRPPVQDMPPPGGYAEVNLLRKARARGPTGIQMWLISSVAIFWGFSQIGSLNRRKSAKALEDRKKRASLAPILQAEQDKKYQEREKEIRKVVSDTMKDVPNFNVDEPTYKTNRWVKSKF